MRAIIIQDADAKALLDRLELRSLQLDPRPVFTSKSAETQSIADVHRTFHYEVTRWLQEQGCDVVRR